MNEFTEEYYRIFELDCLPEGTSTGALGRIVNEKYRNLKPRMFRKEEFEKILAAGIISLEENAQLIDGFILVPEPQEHRGLTYNFYKRRSDP